MNESIIEIIRSLAPPFKKIDSSTLSAWVELAKMMVCEKRFAKNYDMAVALYTLHIATLNGAMKGENEGVGAYSQRLASFSLSGEFSQTFASTAAENKSGNDFKSTQFGSMYWSLLRKSGGGFGLLTTGQRCI